MEIRRLEEKDEQAGGNNEPLRARLLDLYAQCLARQRRAMGTVTLLARRCTDERLYPLLDRVRAAADRRRVGDIGRAAAPIN